MAKGLYKPLHPEKYLGDPSKIRFLSAWELKFMQFCDINPNILSWGSEEFKIPYLHPIKKKVCNYIPDFIIKYKNAQGTLLTEVVEIKPKSQSVISPKMSNYDKVQLVINHSKWTAAEAFCKSRGVSFRVLTEKELFRQKGK